MSEEVIGIVTASGILQSGDPRKANATIPPFEGRHLWIYTAVYKVTEPARDHQNFDSENLLSMIGPGCWYCEQVWRPTIGSKCPGDPQDE